MANTFTCLNVHVIFSTKNHEPCLGKEVRERLWPYLGGIAAERGAKPLAIGGVSDHVHLLLSMPANLTVSDTVQSIKGVSSRWVKTSFPNVAQFAWQDGYGAFSVSHSQVVAVREYIHGQEEHHRTKSFAEEYRAFMERHGIPFEDRYLLG